MRKKLINFVFVGIAIAGLTTIASCKKGENDPFLSLKSRKARISGEWKLEEGTLTSSSTNTFGGTTTTSSSTTTYTSSTCTSSGGGSSYQYQYSETLTIDKDGTYKVEYVDDGDIYSVGGNWFFAGKIKDLDLKKKEAIILVQQEYNEPGYNATYNGFYGGDVLIIDQLKNKEIIFKGEFSYSSTGYSSNNTYDRTFVKK